MNYQDLIDQLECFYKDFMAQLEALKEGEPLTHELAESPSEELAEGVDMGIPNPVALDGYEEEQMASKNIAQPYGGMGRGICINLHLGV